jgi:hypothetical protein
MDAGTIIALGAFLLTLAALLIQRRQFKLELSNRDKELADERAYKQRARDHSYAMHCLERIVPSAAQRDNSTTFIYSHVFSDQELRARIERYLIEPVRRSGQDVVSRTPDFQNPECCRTIGDVVEIVEKYRNEYPREATAIRLPERP